MKKYIFILLAIVSTAASAQVVVQQRAGFYPNGQAGKIYNDTIHYLPSIANYYFNSFGNFVAFNTDSISEGSTNKWYTDARARAAISLTFTTSGSSGAATGSYNNSTGVFNINVPQYAGTTYTGTTNRITVTGSVIDISSAYVGQTSITTLGTIGTGIWNGTPVTVPFGGTGNNTFTAYSLIAAGTTPTGTFQNVSGVGTSGQVLTSNGAGALPTWQTAGGGSGWALTGNASTTPGTNFVGTTDDQNIVFKRNGYPAGLIDSSGTANGKTFFGAGAGAINTGTANTGFGWKTLSLNVSGTDNTAVGNAALKANTGNYNVAVGSGALKLNTTGSSSIAIGADALGANLTGSNVAMGRSALALATGSYYTAVGTEALSSTTSGQSSTAMGHQAAKLTTGSYIAAFGELALVTNTSGQYHAAFGARALQFNTGTGNTAIGAFAGQNLTSGNYNTRVGAEAVANTGITTGAKNTLIGANIGGLSSSLSNTVILADGDGNQRFYSGSTGVVSLFKGADVASAAAIVPTGSLFHVTGTTTITSITTTGLVAGAIITIIFDGALTFTDGSNLKLAGDFSTSAGATISLVYDGTNCYERSRSTN
jgi:hypothetical protein